MFSIAENNGITVLLYDPNQVQNPAMTNEVCANTNIFHVILLQSLRLYLNFGIQSKRYVNNSKNVKNTF